MTGGTDEFDLAVIGGGINGAGIARDAAMRGLSVLLVDQGDFGAGTSSWSSRLIHGGLRYLEYGEIPLVYESLNERRRLLSIAPHLVRPLRLLIPIYRGGRRPAWQVRLGLLAYDLLSFRKSLPGHKFLDADAVSERAPGIRREGLDGAASYFDAQVTYAERLVLENVIAASAAGADVRNYHALRSLSSADRGNYRLSCRDLRHDRDYGVRARAVVNAAGPWVDRVLANSDEEAPRLIGGTKGSHVTVDPFPGAPRDACYVEAPEDGRPVFIIPWNGQYLVGTTDIRFDGDPADARATHAEVRYLLATVNSVFPEADLAPEQVNYAYAGVRPLPFVEEGPESAITRRHILHEHEDGRFLSVVGGKLTTYRNLAEQVTDRVERTLTGSRTRCETGNTALPGGRAASLPEGFAGLDAAGRRRLLHLYGSRCERLVELCREQPALAETIGEGSGALAGEVVMAIREEFAKTLTDLVHRRLMTGLAPDRGQRAVAAILDVAAGELGWDRAARDRELADLARWNERLAPAADSG